MPLFKLRNPMMAKQWHAHGDHPHVVPAWSTPEGVTVVRSEAEEFGIRNCHPLDVIADQGGCLRVQPGDWIITLGHGRYVAMRPDAFERWVEPCGNVPLQGLLSQKKGME